MKIAMNAVFKKENLGMKFPKILVSNYGLSLISGFACAMILVMTFSAAFGLSRITPSPSGVKMMGFIVPIILALFGRTLFLVIRDANRRRPLGSFGVIFAFLATGVLTTLAMWK